MNPVKRQSTIDSPVMCAGVELHGGEHTRLVMRPAPIGTGIVFVRMDVEDRNNQIQVSPEAVTGVKNCTTLSNAAGVSVAMIEHLDGSSEPYLNLIDQVGVTPQPAPRRYVKILKPIEVFRGDSWARIEPCDQLELDVTIDFADAAIGRQRLQITPNVRSFLLSGYGFLMNLFVIKHWTLWGIYI